MFFLSLFADWAAEDKHCVLSNKRTVVDSETQILDNNLLDFHSLQGVNI